MRSYISFGELEELGETIVREYLRKTKRYNALCVDIEGLVTDYLGLTVVYENIAEDDPNKIAFLSNGKRPLWVSRNGERMQVVFPKGTVVMDKVLLHENESSRRRFTLGHEGAHSVIAKQNPMQDVGCFHNEFDPERVYTIKEQKELMSFSETQADRLSSVFLMPRFILRKVMKKYKCENGLPVYGWNVFAPEDKLKLRKMADCMGVFFTGDLHFGHANVIAFDNRPFKTVEEMDAELIRRWNSKVGKGDLTYVLGDMIWKARNDDAPELIKNLNGQIILIKGYVLIFGHTPTCYFHDKVPWCIWKGDNAIGIDCGSGYEYGRLSCLRLDDMKEFYSDC